MLVTESGMVTDDKLVHVKKAVPSMLVTESGMLTDDRLVHERKAPSPMLVTELGMLTCPLASGRIIHVAETHASAI
jgi:hypothetical protein